MRGLLLACVLALAAAALGTAGTTAGRPACHPEDSGYPTRSLYHGNVDRDADMERVVAAIRGCPHQVSLVLEDRCLGGTRRFRLPGSGVVARLDFVEANGKADGHELLFGLRAGKPSYGGNVALLRLEPPRAGPCRRPYYLLDHRLRPRPTGVANLTELEILRSSRRELRITESFGRSSRETRFRYVPRRNRYVRYRVTIKRA
jgi:hypothetical protein